MITHLMIHVLDARRTACARCGTPLTGLMAAPPLSPLLFDAGVRMGRVVADHGGTHTWPAGEKEQTPECGSLGSPTPSPRD